MHKIHSTGDDTNVFIPESHLLEIFLLWLSFYNIKTLPIWLNVGSFSMDPICDLQLYEHLPMDHAI